MRRLLLAALLLTLAPAAVSQSSVCLSASARLPRITIEQITGKILQPQDLTVRDLPVWKVNHAGQCPGIASGNFYPTAQSSYIIALIRRGWWAAYTDPPAHPRQEKQDRNLSNHPASRRKTQSPSFGSSRAATGAALTAPSPPISTTPSSRANHLHGHAVPLRRKAPQVLPVTLEIRRTNNGRTKRSFLRSQSHRKKRDGQSHPARCKKLPSFKELNSQQRFR